MTITAVDPVIARAKSVGVDILIRNQGVIVAIRMLNDKAREWFDANVTLSPVNVRLDGWMLASHSQGQEVAKRAAEEGLHVYYVGG